jgi:5-methylcytosine-specific restriction endonuclease McrA
MGVLLLNATYEPIRVVTLKRAVVLILQEKVDIVEQAGELEIHSQDVTIPKPEVIRLRYYVKIPYKSRVPLSNRAVLNRDKFTCAYCGKRASTVDHVHPKAKKGPHDWTNVVAACKKCNSKKADNTLEHMQEMYGDKWKLKFTPAAPTARTWIVVGTPERAEAWAEYLESA